MSDGVGVLLMAAGSGTRYKAKTGSDECKLLAPIPNSTMGETVFLRSLQLAMAEFGSSVHVVVSDEETALFSYAINHAPTLSRVKSSGLGDSIAEAVRCTADWKGWLIMLADMPYLQPSTLRAVRLALKQHLTARPIWRGCVGHPVGFSERCFEDLTLLQGDLGARTILKRYPPHLIELSDRGAVWDIDLPEHLLSSDEIMKNKMKL